MTIFVELQLAIYSLFLKLFFVSFKKSTIKEELIGQTPFFKIQRSEEDGLLKIVQSKHLYWNLSLQSQKTSSKKRSNMLDY